MPELPEVETIARTLAPQIEGRHIDSVTVLLPRAVQAGEHLLPALAGARIAGVRRRAKLLLLDVLSASNAPLVLAFHLKMTGSFFVHPQGTAPLKHTRLVFDLGKDGRLFFDDTRTFGWCRIMQPEALPAWPFWAALGPEPLEGDAVALVQHLAGVFAGKKKALKACLLDQNILAGIGNIYADESLFKAGLLPQRPATSLGNKDIAVLVAALRSILTQSIEECGSSIRDYRDAQGNAGAFQNNFSVYGRKGEQCRTCGQVLASGKVAGRGTVWCARCQR